mgnify:FL=1
MKRNYVDEYLYSYIEETEYGLAVILVYKRHFL